MSAPIEDYALVGDMESAALVARDGSIDWLCLPRFDSDACFAALLGGPEHGRWRIGPRRPVRRTRRRYRDETLILETELEDDVGGLVRLVDFMPPRDRVPNVVRVVEGVRGEVELESELALRFGYGAVLPWISRRHGGLWAIAGPDAVRIDAAPGVPLDFADGVVRGRATLRAGERLWFSVAWHPSHVEPPPPRDPFSDLEDTERFWRGWAAGCRFRGEWREAVVRSLITLKALTYGPTGGIVAAATTSLPEQLGGVRNWDYRYCWLRDATFTLFALMSAGYHEEAAAWRDWLLRAVAGDPRQMQIMYGPAGERRLTELELDWLPGYAGSRPVRAGNAAVRQFQLDVYGEVMDCLYQAEAEGVPSEPEAATFARRLVERLESCWSLPDEGIWEVRGPRRHFTHSKVMAWVAFDRAVKGGHAPPEVLARWQAVRDQIHAEVCARGFSARRRAFVQSYDGDALDASLLMMPLVGFLPAGDERVRLTVAAIERELVEGGLVRRYSSGPDVDGLPPGEGVFLACTFWLADNLILLGRRDEARAIFERLLSLRNDVGLLAEQCDPVARRLLGNYPQAFSHVSLVNTALNLAGDGPGERRRARGRV